MKNNKQKKPKANITNINQNATRCKKKATTFKKEKSKCREMQTCKTM